MRGLIVEANQQPELAGVFSTFSADTPQIYLDIDRDKAQTLGVEISDIFNALQATLGGFYVNDFNLFGRTWQVNIQAEHDLPARRSTTSTRSMSATGTARWCRCASLASVRLELGPQALIRYNIYRSATINGAAGAGLQLGRSARRDGADLGDHPAGRATASSGPARRCRRRRPPARPTIVLGLAVLFAYLFLVALYESWNIPIPVLLSVTSACSAPSRGAVVAGSTSTSTPRSASSC